MVVELPPINGRATPLAEPEAGDPMDLALGNFFAASSKAEAKALFKKFDTSGNGSLSMSEVSTAIGQHFPDFHNSRAIKLAYKAADEDDSGVIGIGEFSRFLGFLGFFAGLAQEFAQIDADGDGRLSLREFLAAAELIDVPVPEEDLDAEFRTMDDNGGGFVTFDEFCSWCARRQLPQVRCYPHTSLSRCIVFAVKFTLRGVWTQDEEPEEAVITTDPATHSIFVFDATAVEEAERWLRRGGIETTAAVVPDWELVFAGKLFSGPPTQPISHRTMRSDPFT